MKCCGLIYDKDYNYVKCINCKKNLKKIKSME